jgi:hypothetical protein
MGAFPSPEGRYIRNITSLRELTTSWYGALVESHPVETDYSLTTTATQIGSLRGQRIAAFVSNTGANNAAVSFSSNITITNGILLQPGGFFAIDWRNDFDMVFKQLWAIAATGNTTLTIIENILSGG